MPRSATVACAALLCGWVALGACDSDLVHLGDGRGVKDGGGTTGDADAAACQRGQVKGSEVVWIGDTWVTIPGTQHRRVRDYAREAGAIGTSDEYVILAEAAADMATIARQYETRQAGATKVKVLIMDGGTWETINARPGSLDAVIANVVATFGNLLAEVAAGGSVEHVIYFLCPDLPGIPGVATLRPLLQQACADSDVPCHFLDLDRLWRPEYTAATGYQANEAGAIVIADALWELMQDNCIAQ